MIDGVFGSDDMGEEKKREDLQVTRRGLLVGEK